MVFVQSRTTSNESVCFPQQSSAATRHQSNSWIEYIHSHTILEPVFSLLKTEEIIRLPRRVHTNLCFELLQHHENTRTITRIFQIWNGKKTLNILVVIVNCRINQQSYNQSPWCSSMFSCMQVRNCLSAKSCSLQSVNSAFAFSSMRKEGKSLVF